MNNITSKEWEQKLQKVDIDNYKTFRLWKADNKSFANFKPSDLLTIGEYPFSNFEDN